MNYGGSQYPLNQIYFYLTEGCNLYCRHCWISPKYQAEGRVYPSLPLPVFKKIIHEAKPLGLIGVKLTGGEPLLHPNIGEILDFIRAEDLTLNVETNGILCTPELAKQIASCKNVAIGVSLDGSNAETHEWMRGVKGSFNRTIQGIKNLVDAGLKPQIVMTLMRRNVGQIEAVIQLGESLGVSSIKFNIIQPTGRGKKMYDDSESLSFNELLELGEWVENTLTGTTQLRLHYSHPIAFKPLGNMLGEKNNGCSVCGIKGIIGVLANGSYALCGIGETVPELIFGNAIQDNLKTIWQNNKIICELREGLPKRLEGICGNCLMKNICLGDCIAQNYSRTNDLWAPFWYCKEAQRLGKFPDSRKIKI